MNIQRAMKILLPLLPKHTGSNCFTWSDLCAVAEHVQGLDDALSDAMIRIGNQSGRLDELEGTWL